MLYNFLKVNKKLSLAAYEIQKNIKGLDCKVYAPKDNNSIFGLEDSLIEYEEPREDKFLIYNLFQEGFEGSENFDAFIDDVYILAPPDDRLSLKTKIEVSFYDTTFYFIIDDIKSKTPQISNPLFLKYILVPAT